MRASRVGVLLFLGLIGVRLAVVPIALASDATDGRRHQLLTGDVRRFHKIANSHGRPYRDFDVEYPPVMLAAIETLDGPTVHQAAVRLMWSQVALDIAITGIVAWAWGRRAALAYLVIGLPFVVYPFLYLRLDLLSVSLAIGGVALVRRRFPGLGGATLAAGCFAKLWPLLVAPALLVRRSLRATVAFTTVGAAGLVAWLAWAGTGGPIQVLTLRGARGWELESTVGAILRRGGDVHADKGAWRYGIVPGWARVALLLALLAGAVAIWRLAARARPGGPGVIDGLAPLTVIVAFLVLSPLLSPQFACWLVPYAAIASVHGERTIGRLGFVVVSLSVLLLWRIKQLIDGDFPMLVIVQLRNATLVALLVVGVVRLVRLARVHLPLPAGAVPEPAEAAA